MPATIDIKDNQSLLDLAVGRFGSLEAVFALALINQLSVTDALVKGDQLNGVALVDEDIADFFSNNEQPATWCDEDSLMYKEPDTTYVYQLFDANTYNKATVSDNQSMFDVAIQMAGSVEAVFSFALINEASITDFPDKGSILKLPEVFAKKIREEYEQNGWIPASASNYDGEDPEILLEGIGYWAIDIDFIVS